MACESPLAPYEDQGVNPAWIVYGGSGPEISLPDSAALGSTVEVTIATYSGACTTQGETKVVQTAMRLEIAPLSVYPKPRTLCIDILIGSYRHVSFTPRSRGLVTVRVHGTKVTNIPDRSREPVTITRTLMVY
jgi:hypothetical protein